MARDLVKMSLHGDREIRAAIDELTGGRLNRAVRQAATKAARPIRTEAKAQAPKDQGHLRRSMTSRVTLYRNSGTVYVAIGPRSAKTGGTYSDRRDRAAAAVLGSRAKVRRKIPANYAHLVEYGTRHMPSHSFLRVAFIIRKGPAQRIFDREIRVELARMVEQQRRKRAKDAARSALRGG